MQNQAVQILVILLLSVLIRAQTEIRIMGEVSSVDPDSGRIEIVQADGQTLIVHFDDQTQLLSVPAGETTLKNARRLPPDQMTPGDRLLARGSGSEGIFIARQIVVVSRTSIEQKRERERQAWRERGILGVVTSIDPARREITIRQRTSEGPKPIIITTNPKVIYRRYSDHSVRYADSSSSSFDELKVGDHLRALGEKNGTSFRAEIIITGTFAMAGGTITEVRPGGEIVIDDIPRQKSLVVVINEGSKLRRLPPEMGSRLAGRLHADAGEAMRSGGRPTPGARGGSDGSRGSRPAGLARAGDLQQMLEGLPAIDIKDLEPGDSVLLSSIVGEDPGRVTAILLVSGVAELIERREETTSSSGLPMGPSLSFPNDVLDFGVGDLPDENR